MTRDPRRLWRDDPMRTQPHDPRVAMFDRMLDPEMPLDQFIKHPVTPPRFEIREPNGPPIDAEGKNPMRGIA